MRKHLAIISEAAIKQIFSGQKTIETRFSKKRIAPFGLVSVGDIIYIKPPGKEVVGQFKVSKVITIEGIEPDDWKQIRQSYGKMLSLGSKKRDDEYFKNHQNARFGTLIFIDELEQFITSPIKISKKDLRGWVVL